MRHQKISREISASRQEFARGIRAAFPEAETVSDRWLIHWLSASAEVTLTPMADLTIGSVTLPRHHCEICLSEGESGDADRLLRRMDQYQQRGGG